MKAEEFRLWQRKTRLNGKEIAERLNKSPDTISDWRTHGVPAGTAPLLRLALLALLRDLESERRAALRGAESDIFNASLAAGFPSPRPISEAPEGPILVFAQWTWDGKLAEGTAFSWRIAERDDGAVDSEGELCTRFSAVCDNPYTDWSTDPRGWLPLPAPLEEEVVK